MDQPRPVSGDRKRAQSGIIGQVAEWASKEIQQRNKKPLNPGVKEYDKNGMDKSLLNEVENLVRPAVGAHFAPVWQSS